MREGLFDVLPAGALDGLTAEDFRLLVNDVGFRSFLIHSIVLYYKLSFLKNPLFICSCATI